MGARAASFNLGAARPNLLLADGARTYAERRGVTSPAPDFSRAVVTPEAQGHIASAYDEMPDFDERALPAFNAMRHETGRQFDFLTRSRKHGGLGVDVSTSFEDPYSGPAELMRDLQENRRMRVLATTGTGSHPIFTDGENDQFRAVHDAFGHAGTGRGFDRHGEEAAYLQHARMYSPLARRALATETRGQNASLITNGQFPRQKVGLLPETMSAPVPLVGRQAHFLRAVKQARGFNQDQFGAQE